MLIKKKKIDKLTVSKMSREEITELRKSLISEIKKRPRIWQTLRRRPLATALEWGDIQKKFSLPLHQLLLHWQTVRKHYLTMLMKMAKKEEVNPWPLFHDMSFMHEFGIQIIARKLNRKPQAIDELAAEIAKSLPKVQPKDQPNNALRLRSKKLRKNLRAKKKRDALIYKKQEMIIKTVKSYPALYVDPKPVVNDSLLLPWQSVAKELGIPMSKVRRRWRNLKTRFMAELIKGRDPKDGSFLTDWEHFKQMLFLVDYLPPDIAEIYTEQKCYQIVDISSDEEGTNPSNLAGTLNATDSQKPVEIDQDSISPEMPTNDLGGSSIDDNSENEYSEIEDLDFTNDEGDSELEVLVFNKEDDDSLDFTSEEEDQEKRLTNNEEDSVVEVLDDDRGTDDLRHNKVTAPVFRTDKFDGIDLSNEEDNNKDADVHPSKHNQLIFIHKICDDTMTSNASEDVYEREFIYFSESVMDDIICLDDDEESE